jgi:hypothetical protein
VFTSVDDDTVGESMNGYSGSGYTGTNNASGYANPALKLGGTSLTVSGCVFRYAQKAVQYAATSTTSASLSLTHCQLFQCIRGIDLTWGGCGSAPSGASSVVVSVNNGLFAGIQNPLYVSSLNQPVSHTLINCSVDQASYTIGGSWSGTLTYNSTNTVYSNVTNANNYSNYSFKGNNNGYYNAANAPQFSTPRFTVTSSPFQNAGAGNYYLTDLSMFRNQGTSSGVSTSLASDLNKRTTYPPLVVANVTNISPQTYSPQAGRDTDTLDLGYHYDPLDWELGGVLVTNATVTINPGAVIGTFATSTATYGLCIGQNATLQCQGLPNKQNWIVQFNTVQEQPYTNWSQTSGGMLSSELYGLTGGSTINCRFTSWSLLSQAAPHLVGPTNNGPLNFQDCEFHGGKITTTYPTVNLTNCLLERVYTDLEHVVHN